MLPHLLTRRLRLALIIACFTAAFALFGAEGWGGNWRGYVAGGLVGLVFGLVCDGAWVDQLFPPGDAEESGPKPSTCV